MLLVATELVAVVVLPAVAEVGITDVPGVLEAVATAADGTERLTPEDRHSCDANARASVPGTVSALLSRADTRRWRRLTSVVGCAAVFLDDGLEGGEEGGI